MFSSMQKLFLVVAVALACCASGAQASVLLPPFGIVDLLAQPFFLVWCIVFAVVSVIPGINIIGVPLLLLAKLLAFGL